MKECELCHVCEVGEHPYLCDSCVRDVDMTMYEAQMTLHTDDITFKKLIEDWLVRNK